MAAGEAAFVAIVLVMMLSLLFVGWKTPEVVVSGRVLSPTAAKTLSHICARVQTFFILKLVYGAPCSCIAEIPYDDYLWQ